MSKSGLAEAPAQDDRARVLEGVEERSDRGHGAGARGRAGHRFHEVDAGVEPIALVAAEEERLVLDQRPAEGGAELVQAQVRLLLLAVHDGIEGVRRGRGCRRGSTRRDRRGSCCCRTWSRP